MLPFNNLIKIKKPSDSPVYIQIANSIISLIQEGILQKGTKLPGSRILSEMLQVHRKTVIAAYQELTLQGWIKSMASSGTKVSDNLPEIAPKKFTHHSNQSRLIAGFSIKENKQLSSDVYKKTPLLEMNDGLPDERLAPLESLARSMRSVLKGHRGKLHLSYSDLEGSLSLREELCSYLNETRGFNNTTHNFFITRGTVMGLYLSLKVLINEGDNVVMGIPGYRTFRMIADNLKANLIKIPIDDGGLIIDELEKVCRNTKIRAIYVTPHHHYPTTVTMPPERRIALLSLAQKWGIAIIEDDYDYDYHFSHSPFLPLAASDPAGLVIYIGSFSKTLSPAFRVGYIAAPENMISEIAKVRRIIDRQGDSVLEHAISEMMKLGEIKAHLRKSHAAYKERREFFCNLLKEKFPHDISFSVPEGGMAVWATFNKSISLPKLSSLALKHGLYFSNGLYFNQGSEQLNSTRLGFASLNIAEIERAVSLLELSLNELKS